MSEVGAVVGITFGVIAVASIIVAIVACTKCFKCVQEKEVIIIERCGKYSKTLTPGIHCIFPFCDAPRVCNTSPRAVAYTWALGDVHV